MKKRNKIIAVLLCFLLTFFFVMGKPDESHAAIPLAIELAVGLTLASSGLSITSTQYTNGILAYMDKNMTEDDKLAIENAVNGADGEIVISEEVFQRMQVLAQQVRENEIMWHISQGNIINVPIENGYTVLYLKTSLNIGDYSDIALKHAMFNSGEYYINDNFKFIIKKPHSSNNYHRIFWSLYRTDVSEWRENSLSNSNYQFVIGQPIYFSFIYEDHHAEYSNRLKAHFTGLNTNGNIVTQKVSPGMLYTPGVLDIVDFVENYVQEYQQDKPAPLVYNVYNPPLDDDGNVRIPWPADLGWEKLLNKSGEDIWNLPGTGEVPGETPGEGGKDYTGILGAILAAVGAVSGTLSDVLTSIRDFSKINDFDLDFEPLKVNFTDRFPFCIPFDFIRLISVFSSAPSDFTFNIKLETAYFNINHTVDLSPFQVPILFFRYVVVFWFVYILISRTRDFIKW